MLVSEAGKKGGAVRGTEMKGEKNPNAKLTPERAELIRRCKGKLSSAKTALAFNIHPGHVQAIWQGRYWKNAG